MIRSPRATRHRAVFASIAIAAVAIGCNLVVGSYDYRDGSDAGGDGLDSDAGGEEAGCDVDLTRECYACTPVTNEQFLNGCGEATCIPFDRTRLDGLLSADGALPPLPPPKEGGP